MEEKDAKDHSGGVCGLPLKTPGGSFRSQRYIRYAPRVRVSAGWYALTVPGAAQRCGTSFQRLVCGDPPVRKCLRISENVRAFGAHWLWSRPITRRGLFRRSAAALFTSTDGKQICFDSDVTRRFHPASAFLSDSGCTRGPAVSRSRIAPYRSLKCRFALVLCRGGCGRRRHFLRASILL